MIGGANLWASEEDQKARDSIDRAEPNAAAILSGPVNIKVRTKASIPDAWAGLLYLDMARSGIPNFEDEPIMPLREAELSRSQRAARAHAKQQARKKKVRRSVGIGHNLGPAFEPLLEDRVLTFIEWCKVNSLSPRTGRRILANGNGPVVTRVSERRIGVTVKANREWQAERSQ